MKWLWLLVSMTLLSACGAYAQGVDYHFAPKKNMAMHQHQFMPDNILHRYDNMQIAKITESEFNSILDKIESVYTPIFKSFGATFVLERAWADSTVNAYADQQGSRWIIHMYGGMARRSEMNVAGFALVACHEIGHHLAGFPKYSDSVWAANEGQSDYFSTFACGRKVLAGLSYSDLSAQDIARCDAVWGDQASRQTCYVSLSGGLSLGKLLAVLGGEKTPSYATPDSSVVTKTQDEHPRAQCRTDTYLAGSVCQKTWNDSVIPKDASAVCDTRPRCWYAPSGDGGGDGGEPPPIPDPMGDDILASGVNNVRMQYRVPMIVVDPQLICAAKILTDDLAGSGRCSHITSDGQGVTARLRECGYPYGGTQTLACGHGSSDLAVKAWSRDRYNLPVLVSRTWKSIGCASSSKRYVCLFGNK